MKAWTAETAYLQVHRAASGWIIRRAAKSERGWPEDVAGLSDDQALLEFFAEQLSMSAPDLELAVRTEIDARARLITTFDLPGHTPQPLADEAPAAAMAPPPVSAGEDVGALAAELTTAMRILGDVCAAMKPFADLGRACRDRDDVEMVCFKQIPGTDEYADIEVRHVRALLRAAGLFTDDMRPSQPPPAADASVKPAEVAATPPPADAEGACPVCGCAFGDLHAPECTVPDDAPVPF